MTHVEHFGAAALLATACLAWGAGALDARQDGRTREDRWREDLDAFGREFPARHVAFAKLYPPARFTPALEAIRRTRPQSSDAEVVLGLMRLVATAHVGHTMVRMPPGPMAFRRLPLTLTWYRDGLAVTAASDAYREALGLRVV